MPASQRGSLAQVAVERIFAHDDAEVVFGLSEQTVGIDQLGRVRLPARSIDERHRERARRSHRGAHRHDASRARQRVLDGALCTGGRVPPHCGDELPEPPGLAGAGRQIAVWSGRRSAPRRRSGSRAVDDSAIGARREDDPTFPSRSAPRPASSRRSRGHPSPAASRNTVISRSASSPPRGTMSFNTAGAPSSQTASATNASVESRYARPTVIPQSTSTLRTSKGSASTQALPQPTALSREQRQESRTSSRDATVGSRDYSSHKQRGGIGQLA